MSSKYQKIMKHLLNYMIFWTCCVNLTFSFGISVNLELGIGNRRQAKEGEFPWMTALYLNGILTCSSFLISPNFVLTAAHCVKFEDGVQPATYFYGIVGNIDREGPDTYILFKEVMVHPDFNPNQNLEYDIAILRTSSPVEVNKFIQPICLSQDDRTIDIATMQTMGWGSAYIRRDDVAEYMTTTELSILPRHTCKQIFEKHKGIKITNKNICVYSPKKTGLCYGDSGSPALYHDTDSGKSVAIGVASFISYYGCFIPKAPRVYTRIASYIDWIKEAVGDYKEICFI